MMKRIILIQIVLFLLPAALLYSGDVASFVNLGFSANSRYFMFSQYGIKESNSGSYADLFLVEVPLNIFVPYGQKSVSYTQKTEPGTFGLAALVNIIEENIALLSKYGINHLSTGRIIYHLMDNDFSKEELYFRDFVTGNQYSIHVTQNASGTGKNVRSSFTLQVTITLSSGKTRQLSVGHPAYDREGVRYYRLKQLIVAPDENSLVFVIEKEEVRTMGIDIRYMVETAKITN